MAALTNITDVDHKYLLMSKMSLVSPGHSWLLLVCVVKPKHHHSHRPSVALQVQSGDLNSQCRCIFDTKINLIVQWINKLIKSNIIKLYQNKKYIYFTLMNFFQIHVEQKQPHFLGFSLLANCWCSDYSRFKIRTAMVNF